MRLLARILLESLADLNISAMRDNEAPIANPYVMLREEFDDWAVLFDPDTGHGFGLSPTGVHLWKLLDGEHAIDDLFEEIQGHSENVPDDAKEYIRVFVDALVAEGLAGCGDTRSYRDKSSHALLAALNEVKPFTYEPPKLINLNSRQAAQGACSGGSQAPCCSPTGHLATSPGSGCSFGCGDTYDKNCACTGGCPDGTGVCYSDGCHPTCCQYPLGNCFNGTATTCCWPGGCPEAQCGTGTGL
jgi:SynChlorMet cassette protein ScmD